MAKAGIDTLLNNNQARAIDVEVYGSDFFSLVAADNRNPTYTRVPQGSSSWTTDETPERLASNMLDKHAVARPGTLQRRQRGG